MNSSSSNDRSKRTIGILSALLILLLGSTSYLLFQNSKKSTALSKTTIELNETEKLKADLEKQYYEALASLEEQKGSNVELNNVIDAQKEELKVQKDKIAGLLGSSRDLKKARQEISNLNAKVSGYLAEINTLRNDKELLAAANQQLETDKATLSTKVKEVEDNVAQLSTEKAMLTSQKEELETTKQALTKKVNIASAIRIQNVKVEGFKVRSSGKESKRSKAKNIDRLKICFDALANSVVPSGDEKFFIRIINPIGETIAVEENGGGVLKNNLTNEDVRYTKTAEIDYKNDDTNACTTWDSATDLQKGEYLVEIYNKGYLVGKSSYKLK